MATLPLSEPASAPPTGWRPFALGFRPFFVVAGIAAVLAMATWVIGWNQGVALHNSYGQMVWHGHEMLFGYVPAVVAGFLLTAVRNWTGIDTPTGVPLALLVGLWLAARLLPWLPEVPTAVVAGVDLAFIPLLMVALLKPLWMGRNRVNRIFLLFLAMMAGANLLVHADLAGYLPGWGARGTQWMLDTVLLLLAFIAGRVVPFFVEQAVPGASSRNRQGVEVAGYLLFGLMMILHLAGIGGGPVALVMIALALVQGVRLLGWWHPGVHSIPILWILFAGYLWLALGLGLVGLATLGWLPRAPALHALTAGAIGVLTLGMMARVALGHTGRKMESAVAVNSAFVILNIGVAVRVFGPLLVAEWWSPWITLSGLLWVAAFALFCWVYIPILLRPRVDGAPG